MSQPTAPGGGRKPDKPPSHERWIISYADLLTLLLATFIVLYASSSRNQHREDQITAGFIKAFHGTAPKVVTTSSADRGVMRNQPSPIVRPVAAPASANSKIAKDLAHQMAAEVLSLQKVAQKLNSLMQPLIARNEVAVQSLPLTLTIQLNSSVLFPSGEATLKPPAVVLLHQVAASLTKLPAPFTIVVQGYTDDQPIATPQFPSNWSLSAERAVRVVELFWGDGVNGYQLAAQGFAQFAPVVPNTSDANRALNRRVVVVIHAPTPTAPQAGADGP